MRDPEGNFWPLPPVLQYFHGDNGAGLGASHQTGWTWGIARLLHVFASLTPKQFLEAGRAYFESTAHGQSGPLAELLTTPVGEIFPVESENHGAPAILRCIRSIRVSG